MSSQYGDINDDIDRRCNSLDAAPLSYRETSRRDLTAILRACDLVPHDRHFLVRVDRYVRMIPLCIDV